MLKRRTPRNLLLAALGLAAATLLLPLGAETRAEPAACASEPVTARGEPARFLWMARTKARANWRRRVRATSTLGPDYSVWGRAINTEERCITGPSGTFCIFTGTPCR